MYKHEINFRYQDSIVYFFFNSEEDVQNFYKLNPTWVNKSQYLYRLWSLHIYGQEIKTAKARYREICYNYYPDLFHPEGANHMVKLSQKIDSSYLQFLEERVELLTKHYVELLKLNNKYGVKND